MNNVTRTAEGDVPHLRAHGMHFPIAVTIETPGRLPVPRVTAKGFGLYVLPGGSVATAADIRAGRFLL